MKLIHCVNVWIKIYNIYILCTQDKKFFFKKNNKITYSPDIDIKMLSTIISLFGNF